ncbi:MAG: Tripartite-type tricarboxylate transporter, receptor component TctC [Rhodoferax sp.]|nr:Tripartite-type tricarboxylate transporter, receptor component TctC [Rhodoferax sp.]
MNNPSLRRRCLAGSGALALSALLSMAALPVASWAADVYPSHSIRMVVPYPPGGGNDALGRLVAQRLSTVLGQPVVVENKPGADGNLGTAQVARAKPDGYTLILAFVANMAMTPNMGAVGFDPLKDFAPIGLVAQAYQVLVVNPEVPVRTVGELVALAKAEPNRLNYASGGNGSPLHLAGELFKMTTKTSMQHIPYKGSSPAATAVIGGDAQVIFGGVVSTLPFVRAGRLRALAVTSPKRLEAAPEIPTLDELGYKGVDTAAWYGLFAPAGTPKPIVQRLNDAIVQLTADPDYQAQLAKQGQEPASSTPEELVNYNRVELEKWGKVIKAANIRAD